MMVFGTSSHALHACTYNRVSTSKQGCRGTQHYDEMQTHRSGEYRYVARSYGDLPSATSAAASLNTE